MKRLLIAPLILVLSSCSYEARKDTQWFEYSPKEINLKEVSPIGECWDPGESGLKCGASYFIDMNSIKREGDVVTANHRLVNLNRKWEPDWEGEYRSSSKKWSNKFGIFYNVNTVKFNCRYKVRYSESGLAKKIDQRKLTTSGYNLFKFLCNDENRDGNKSQIK